ncbi:MAG: threonine synthase [Acidobacteria bacterium]|nr:MAG: threonine synthase [Acidobacteriota bacterium]PYR07650.1 MAG: threonine synthase [Acidobacteriota bacterium]PYR14056.1 MAG: threonine synthase [Acidobacteriota bacterium]
MSLFTHLECSIPCGAPALDPHGRHFLCPCGAPLLARYDLDKATAWSRETLRGRVPNMWRYRELMPLFDGEEPITLGEGFTPLVHARALGATIGLDRLYIKDESLNPTNSFKARGQAAAITRAKYIGATTIALPTAGNAGNAAAAYSAAARLACEVFIPKDAKRPFIDECRLYGANVTLVDGLITDAGRLAAEKGAPLGWYDVSTLKEPYRIEGKKTMGYELAEQMNWTLPDWIVYPTGGGTGMVGMWKAFDEMERIGWLPRGKRPKMVSVQAEQCAPIVRAFQRGEERAQPWEGAKTIADGLRVPRAIGDFLILRAVRESCGTAIAVSDRSMIDGMLAIGKCQGISAAPEGGAAWVAIQRLTAEGSIKPHESVVLFNTGGALKYLDVISS